MVSVALNFFESRLDCLFRCHSAVGQFPRIDFKHCRFIDLKPRLLFTGKHGGDDGT